MEKTLMRPAMLLSWLAMILAATALPAHSAEGKFTAEEATTLPPMELKPTIRRLFEAKSIKVKDPAGNPFCEVWFRKSVPGKATPEQIKNGLTYQEIPPTTVVAAIRFDQKAKDYRKQEIKPGVYTLRLATQPQDGDHAGTSPHPDFCLVVSADKDDKPDLMEPKSLHDLSAKSLGMGSHPGVFLLFPNNKPKPKPELVDHGMGHWVIKVVLHVDVSGKPASIGIGLTVVGTAEG